MTFGDQTDDNTAFEGVEAAYNAGVNCFNNADAYARGKSETTMGQVIKKAGWRRYYRRPMTAEIRF